MIAWAAYCVVVAALLGLSAASFESLLRLYGRSTRWPWIGALGASLGLPVASWLVPGWRVAGAGESGGVLAGAAAGVVRLPALVVDAEAAAGAGPGAVFGGVWVGASAAVLLFLLLSHGSLRRSRRAWYERRVDGVPVLVSAATGPAVVGLVRGRIVVPSWALELEPRSRRLMLAHEEEHVRAGDHRLLAVALAGLAAMPWNPAIWWQFRRLRAAIELDCDARVLRREPDPGAYGNLLIELVRRSEPRATPAPALAEPESLVRRRIRIMTAAMPARRSLRAAGLGTAAVLLLVAACESSAPPVDVPAEGALSESAAEGARLPPSLADVEREPVYTPMDAEPRLLNERDVQRALIRAYVPELRDAGIEGTAIVWFLIGADGAVHSTRLHTSSGHDALDEAALATAGVYSFSPAALDGEPVPVWVALPIVFRSRGGQDSPRLE